MVDGPLEHAWQRNGDAAVDALCRSAHLATHQQGARREGADDHHENTPENPPTYLTALVVAVHM